MERWVGQVAIVTGASSGIGAEISKNLVQKGIKVVGLARRVDRIEELTISLTDQPGELISVACDLTKEEDILNAFKWVTENVGPVHVLINNAGFIKPTNLTDGDTAFWKQVMDVNVIALCICTREAIKIMKQNEIDGHIIHINSVLGHKIEYFPNLNVYGASKFAVTALAETLRHDLVLERSRIKISSVSPGNVRTEFQDNLVDQTREMANSIPGLQPSAVADAVAYVLSTAPDVQISELIIRPLG